MYFILHVIFFTCRFIVIIQAAAAAATAAIAVVTVLQGGSSSYSIRIRDNPIHAWDCPIYKCMELSNSSLHIQARTVPYVHK